MKFFFLISIQFLIFIAKKIFIVTSDENNTIHCEGFLNCSKMNSLLEALNLIILNPEDSDIFLIDEEYDFRSYNLSQFLNVSEKRLNIFEAGKSEQKKVINFLASSILPSLKKKPEQSFYLQISSSNSK